ncbi:tryptophan--tRNA ligase [Candidatus Wolfebacteria bacterium]|nr:MAG: tryptophan--tRNA ligase [Candidatus Wolfebacteria bacterium]
MVKNKKTDSFDEKRVVLTGDRPTGKLHLGHYVGSLLKRVELQNIHDQYVMIADVQALTDNAENPDKVRSNVIEVALDNLAVGVDPTKTTFFIQSEVPEIAELTVFFLNLVTLARLKRNPTVKDEMKQKGYKENVPAGFLTYPVSQAADILFCKATIVPVGEDQLPVLEQANEIVHKFNSLYGEVFEKIEPLMSSTPRLVGIDGKSKMSKSLDNAIYLSDSSEVIEKKVMQMYTDPDHIHVNDPGKVKGNVVFEYLDIFDEDKDELKKLKAQYKKGGLGDVEIKRRLIAILQDHLAPIRDRREYLAKDPKKVMEILEEGTKRARVVAIETLKEVREAMRINYF